jgi:hypothetical protein
MNPWRQTAVFFFALLFSATSAFGFGNSEGNGGDAYVLEFTGIAQKVAALLDARSKELDVKVTGKSLLKALGNTTILSVDEVLYLNGIPKDALNYPDEKLIVISRPRWKSIPELQKPWIVMHEILGVMRVPDKNYEITSQLAAFGGVWSPALVTASPQDASELAMWCENISRVLSDALSAGKLAHSATSEKAILLTGIERALDRQPSRFNKFAVATLNAALADVLLIPEDASQQVFLLRTYIGFALADIAALENQRDRLSDNGPYVLQLLSRALQVGALSKSYIEESALLTRAAQRGISLLETSDFRRTPEYACTRQRLIDGLALANAGNEGTRFQVLQLRRLLASVVAGPINCAKK